MERLKLKVTQLFQLNLLLNWWLQLQNNQSQSLLKLILLSSNNIPQVSWTLPLAEHNLTMLSLLLVMELIQPQDNNTTLLETHGDLHGEIKDTSRLLQLKGPSESVESNKLQFIHPLIEIQISYQIHDNKTILNLKIFTIIHFLFFNFLKRINYLYF